mgnify:FL=1
MTSEETEKIFKLLNSNREKELKKKQKQKEIDDLNKLFVNNPSTSFSSIMAYGHMIGNINNKYK